MPITCYKCISNTVSIIDIKFGYYTRSAFDRLLSTFNGLSATPTSQSISYVKLDLFEALTIGSVPWGWEGRRNFLNT